MGTLPSAANQMIHKGTIVVRDSAGRGRAPVDGDGLPLYGFAIAAVDNRTNSEFGGAADAVAIECEFGIRGFKFVAADGTPIPGDELFVVDNATLSVSSNGGTRGRAGFCKEVRDGKAFVWANLESASAAQSKIIPLRLGDLRLSTGAALPAFSAGIDGFELTGSEALGLRINDDSTTATAMSVLLPEDAGGKELTLRIRGFRVGALDVTTFLTVGVFFHPVGAAHTADTTAGGVTSVFDGATNVVSEATLTIAAADVPAGPVDATFTFTPDAATLDTDDLIITSMWLEY
jgi:hypothetical protein